MHRFAPRFARHLIGLFCLALSVTACTGTGPAAQFEGTATAVATAVVTATTDPAGMTVSPPATPQTAATAGTPAARATPSPGLGAGSPRPATPTARSSTPAPGAPPTRGPRAAPSPTPTAVAGPPVLPTAPALTDPPAAQTVHYRFYDPEGTHAAQVATLSAAAEELYASISARTGLSVPEPITVIVQTPTPSSCAARGVAFSDSRRVGLFADAQTPLQQLRAVLAHETVHILHFAAVPDGLDDLTLIEGFANWAILPYWSDWQGFPSFEDATRSYLEDGRFVPLDNPPDDCTVRRRDVIYNERASFVGYLIERYGRERFLAASGTSVRAPASSLRVVADYNAIYGLGFGQLIDDWLAWVRSGASGS